MKQVLTWRGLSPGPADCAAGQAAAIADAVWEYRVDSGPWSSRLPALGAAVDWPAKWVTFTPWTEPGGAAGHSDHPAAITELPSAMTLNGLSACRAALPSYARGVLDLTVGQGAPRQGLWAYAFAELKSALDQEVTVQVRACGPLTWWLDGAKVFQTTTAGVHSFPAKLRQGTHLVAVRIESGAREWNFSGSIAPAGAAGTVEARCQFTAPDAARFAAVVWTGPYADRAMINGRPVPLAAAGLDCDQVALPVSALKAGRNTLSQVLPADAARRAAPGGTLRALPIEEVALVWGPVIARATGEQATIVCRANAESEAVLRIDGREMTSPEGALHRWVVGGLKPGRSYPYTVTPGQGKPRGGTLRTLPADGAVTIGLAGDPQSGARWRDVAASIHKARPDLLVILGDLVADGLAEEAWTRLFFDPAADLLAHVPCVAVAGNHDRRSPVLDRMFLEPLGGANWVQEVGAALLVGLDGGLDWSPPGANARWLDETLAASRKPFIFVMTHYPAYSSRNHGKLAADGRVLERCSRVARTQIVPLLEKHQVTAVFAGHDHGYERSELPSGLSMIITAGAGAGVYGKFADAEKQNPHSKVFVPKHHHSQVRVEGAAAVFTAVTADGRIIDTRTFHPRSRKENHP